MLISGYPISATPISGLDAPPDSGSDCTCCGLACTCNPCIICDNFLCNAAEVLGSGWTSGTCNCLQINNKTLDMQYLFPGFFSPNPIPAWIVAIIPCNPPTSNTNGGQSCSGCEWYGAGPNGGVSGMPLYEALLYYDYPTDLVKLVIRINNNNVGGTNCTTLTYTLARTSFLCRNGIMQFAFASQTGGTCGSHPSTINVTTWGSQQCCQECGEDCGFCSGQMPASNYPNGWSTYLTGFTGTLCSHINNYWLDTANAVFLTPFQDFYDSTGSITGVVGHVGCGAISQGISSNTIVLSGHFYLYDATDIDNTWKIKITLVSGALNATVIYSLASGSFSCTGSNTFSLVSNVGCTAVPATITINPSSDLACRKHSCCPAGNPPPNTIHVTLTDGGGCSCIDPGGGLVVTLTYRAQGNVVGGCALTWYGTATCTCGSTQINVSLRCLCAWDQTSFSAFAFNGPRNWTIAIACVSPGVDSCWGFSSVATAQSFPPTTSSASCSPFQLVFNPIQMSSTGSDAICCASSTSHLNVIATV